MTLENIIFEQEGGIAKITLNRPNQMNSLSTPLVDELDAILNQVERDPQIRVLVITGNGKSFCAGADLQELNGFESIAEMRLFLGRVQSAFSRIERLPKPVIASVNGLALGGGCELALTCDLRIASKKARFGLPEIRIGVIPAAGGTQRLTRIVGPTKALEMLYLGEPIDADEAHRVGLVNRVVAEEYLNGETDRMAAQLAERPPLALGILKATALAGLSVDIHSGLCLELQSASCLFLTEDMEEGVSAFVEKRTPNFKGR